MPDEKKRSGNFRDLDQLVKLFPHEESEPKNSEGKRRHSDNGDIHNRLFERAWQSARNSSP